MLLVAVIKYDSADSELDEHILWKTQLKVAWHVTVLYTTGKRCEVQADMK